MRRCSSTTTMEIIYCDESLDSSVPERMAFKVDSDGGKDIIIKKAIILSSNPGPAFESTRAARRSSSICGSRG